MSALFLMFSACDCELGGSLDNGVCDSTTDVVNNLESGHCHCKKNVEGRRCDSCKAGFWNFSESNPEGCQGWYYSFLFQMSFDSYLIFQY